MSESKPVLWSVAFSEEAQMGNEEIRPRVLAYLGDELGVEHVEVGRSEEVELVLLTER